MMRLSDKMMRHKKRILDYMRKAELDAIRYPHMRFTVYVDESGMPTILEDVAGGTSFLGGDYTFVYDVCYQCSVDSLWEWTDSHGVHPYAFVRDNRAAFDDMWEAHFDKAVSEQRRYEADA